MYIIMYYLLRKQNSHNYRRGEGNGTGEGEREEGEGEGEEEEYFISTNTMTNQGGEKKEHRVPIMMDCVQTTN